LGLQIITTTIKKSHTRRIIKGIGIWQRKK